MRHVCHGGVGGRFFCNLRATPVTGFDTFFVQRSVRGRVAALLETGRSPQLSRPGHSHRGEKTGSRLGLGSGLKGRGGPLIKSTGLFRLQGVDTATSVRARTKCEILAWLKVSSFTIGTVVYSCRTGR